MKLTIQPALYSVLSLELLAEKIVHAVILIARCIIAFPVAFITAFYYTYLKPG